jgi:uncharacterized protein
MTIRTMLSLPFRVEAPIKGLTIVQVAPGATVPPHRHDQGYVVVPFWPATVERITHSNGREVRREPLILLPFVPYYVEATRANETISLTNVGDRFTTFQKLVPDPPITGPQPELSTEQITIVTRSGARHSFVVEVAVTLTQQAVGLMFRPQVLPGRGMLFLWSAPRDVVMYMRNVLVPLDIVFFDQNFVITRIHPNATPGDSTPIPSNGEVVCALEVPGGTMAALGISVGDTLE